MKTYSEYLSEIFCGEKVQKISIDAGFSCPNRDGTISTGGCIYCRNDSFSPAYCKPSDSVTVQLKKGKEFFSRKYPKMKFLAYFQSYTGTYNKSISELRSLYQEALEVEGVVGLVVGTRPDCISEEVATLFEEISKSKPVLVELGAETSHDSTLRLINRNHTWEDVERAVQLLNSKEIRVGLHLIVGLPGEDTEMVKQTVRKAVGLPIDILKFHQLQVLKDTVLYSKLKRGEIDVEEYTLDKYLNLCAEIVRMVPENVVIERFLSQSPKEMVVSPSWGLKNYEFMAKLAKILENK